MTNKINLPYEKIIYNELQFANNNSYCYDWLNNII
jgi:hypothetical protein